MAKPNFQFEKRQRELAKKQKKEEKARRKQDQSSTPNAPDLIETDEAGTSGADSQASANSNDTAA
ncbi:MAG TPA: hypothetical protein VJ548_01445 [Azospira sp.]|nr:hypothetical protein [Azospira sp.]